MDKLKDKPEATENTSEKNKGKFFSGFGSIFLPCAKSGRSALLYDLVTFTLALLFARCHIVFGSHPLGLALIAVLPQSVLSATLGAAVGAVSLGRDGIIYAISGAIVAFLRVIISGGSKTDSVSSSNVFGENLLLRMSVSTLGGFVAAVYEVLLSGFSGTSILFGVSMVLLPPLLTFVLSGVFCLGINFSDFLFSSKNIFSFEGKSEAEKYGLAFFQLSALVSLFFVTLSLSEIELFGISASYIFVSFVTLITAKRFGALRALAVGFVSPLGISGIYAVSFALLGLGSGLLFPFGMGYALIAGGAALSMWSAYSAGLVGFLTTLPEYAIAAALAAPVLKNISIERTKAENDISTKSAEDMVGTMALSYRTKSSAGLDALEIALSSLSEVIKDFREKREYLTEDEYRKIVRDAVEERCKTCDGLALCSEHGIASDILSEDKIVKKLVRGECTLSDDIGTTTSFCQHSKELSDTINRKAAFEERARYSSKKADTAEEYELISKLINEARLSDLGELALNSKDTSLASEAIIKCGFADGVIRVFGERRRHIILSAEDPDGDRITSDQLKSALSDALGARLSGFEYFRREKMVLMECDTCRKYRVECSTAGMAGIKGEISGDTAQSFESADGYFYALLSDGMGQGKLAKETSEFVGEYLRRILNFRASKETVLHMLNSILRGRRDECSATVDLFELDLYNKEATFIKSGAAPSYIKRGDSIFRIRSKTAPIGLMQTIDTEKIRAEVLPDDYVIMVSDGISDSSEETHWLLELLGKPAKRSTQDYAELILAEAKRHTKCNDDMSVIVMKIVAEK